jgi:hypothetical protein
MLRASELPIMSFRRRIDSITDGWHKYALTLSYLCAARANEICGKPLKSDRGTEALGPPKAAISFDKMEDGTELLLIPLHILKRTNRPLRPVALPLGGYDPWADYLVRCFGRLKDTDPILPFTRRELCGLIERYGFSEVSKTEGRKNPLRHIRTNHLFSYYHFQPNEVTIYCGWDMASSSRAFGGSGSLAEYAHFRYTEYVPKLLRKIPADEIATAPVTT